MDNSQGEIRHEIEATRADMVEKIATLEERVDGAIRGVKRSFDFKYQAERRPWLIVGLSVVAGYLLSGLVLGRPTPKAKVVLPDDWSDRLAAQRNIGVTQNLVGMVSGVVTAVGVALARDFASRMLTKRDHTGRDNGHHDASSATNVERRFQ